MTSGKSGLVSRSNGFFVRVRGRVINLDDRLFGIPQPNHSAWSRFALDVNADGLRDHLLSSREGVRDSEEIRVFRQCLLNQFNVCRAAFDEWNRRSQEEIDIEALLSAAPSSSVVEPLLRSVSTVLGTGEESFYVSAPRDLEAGDPEEWWASYRNTTYEEPIASTRFVERGSNAPAANNDPSKRSLTVNADHPFVDKITDGGKRKNAAKLFASSEVLLEGQLQDQGLDQAGVASLLRDRDRVLRLMAGDAPPTPMEALRRLSAASEDPLALERAVGAVFQVLGFGYSRRGGSGPGSDGVLDARLGRHRDRVADFSSSTTRSRQRSPRFRPTRSTLHDLKTSARGNRRTSAFLSPRGTRRRRMSKARSIDEWILKPAKCLRY